MSINQINFQTQLLDKLPMGIIQLTQGALTYYNQYAKELFPELDTIDPNTATDFLRKTMPTSLGKFSLLTEDFDYTVEEKNALTQFTILPDTTSHLDSAHLDRVIEHLRSDLMTVELAKQEIVDFCFCSSWDTEEERAFLAELSEEISPQIGKMNHSLYAIKRLLCNIERVSPTKTSVPLYSLDLVALLRQLSTDVNSLFDKPVLDCCFDPMCSASLTVLSSKTELVQVILGLLSNALVYGDSLEISVKTKEELALVQVHDKNSPVVERPLWEILRGKAQGSGLSPKDGAGLGLLAVQKLLQALGTQLMTEAPSSGGIRYSFHLPIHRGQEVRSQVNTSIGFEEEFELLQELAPVLSRNLYLPEEIDQDF